ncbi:hypothetical protein DTO027I6_10310 [Penicillium roqueforti]|nr:hypothetical protein CBS147337_10444 [Penicillium roqueforti]KAI3179790.1 hypothetical protein DTO027I6_10310 [Penicillium roqueforti]
MKLEQKKSAHHEDAVGYQSESSGSTQMECEGALPGKDDQFGSRYGSKPLRKPDRETELVDSPPCRPYQPTNLANNRDIKVLKSEVEDLKQMVITQQPSLSERRKRKRVSFQDDVS